MPHSTSTLHLVSTNVGIFFSRSNDSEFGGNKVKKTPHTNNAQITLNTLVKRAQASFPDNLFVYKSSAGDLLFMSHYEVI